MIEYLKTVFTKGYCDVSAIDSLVIMAALIPVFLFIFLFPEIRRHFKDKRRQK